MSSGYFDHSGWVPRSVLVVYCQPLLSIKQQDDDDDDADDDVDDDNSNNNNNCIFYTR